MKKFFISILIVIPTFSFGQYDGSTLYGHFFGRTPSARAEALGKSYCSIENDLASYFFNPAGIANINGIEMNGTMCNPNYPFFHKARYYFTSVGYKFNHFLTIGISRNRFTYNEEIEFDTSSYVGTSPTVFFKPYSTNLTLTISSQPIKNIFIGINSNYYTEHILFKTFNTYYFDFGLIKKFQLVKNNTNEHSIYFGASITNFNNSKIKYNYNNIESTNDLPVITRYGINYQLSLNKPLLNDSLKTLQFIILGEYQKLFNYDYLCGLHAGAEIRFLELFCFRAGYYNENIDTRNYTSDVMKSKVDIFTYGFGFQIPIYKLTKIPLNINFDYTTAPKTNYFKDDPFIFIDASGTKKFTTYNIRINLVLKR